MTIMSSITKKKMQKVEIKDVSDLMIDNALKNKQSKEVSVEEIMKDIIESPEDPNNKVEKFMAEVLSKLDKDEIVKIKERHTEQFFFITDYVNKGQSKVNASDWLEKIPTDINSVKTEAYSLRSLEKDYKEYSIKQGGDWEIV